MIWNWKLRQLSVKSNSWQDSNGTLWKSCKKCWIVCILENKKSYDLERHGYFMFTRRGRTIFYCTISFSCAALPCLLASWLCGMSCYYLFFTGGVVLLPLCLLAIFFAIFHFYGYKQDLVPSGKGVHDNWHKKDPFNYTTTTPLPYSFSFFLKLLLQP